MTISSGIDSSHEICSFVALGFQDDAQDVFERIQTKFWKETSKGMTRTFAAAKAGGHCDYANARARANCRPQFVLVRIAHAEVERRP